MIKMSAPQLGASKIYGNTDPLDIDIGNWKFCDRDSFFSVLYTVNG
jgi:hypothetical protein